MRIKQYIKYLTKTIREEFNPRRLILFGSHAYGQSDMNSDIDILIEIETDIKKSKRSIVFSQLFIDREYPLDFIVYTPKELKERASNNDPFIGEIIKKGQVLYERSD